jgi:hypothetical protein
MHRQEEEETLGYGAECSTKEECLEDLKNYYSSPGHPILFAGIENIYQYYRKLIPKNEIENFLSSLNTYTEHKEFHKGQRNPSYSHFKRYQFQCDLVDIQHLADQNDGVRYIFTCIDTFTRFAFARLLRSKDSRSVLLAFKSILSEAGTHPIYLVMDRGTEFYNKEFELFCKRAGIKFYSPDASIHGAFIERFNRTLQDIIYKYMTENQTKRFISTIRNGENIELMPLFLQTYNSRKHRMTGFSPILAENNSSVHYLIRLRQKEYQDKIKPKKVKYRIGAVVRVSKLKGKFDRGYQERAKGELFRIHDIKTNMGIPMYILSNYRGTEIIKGAFYAFEITPFTGEVYRVEKVLKRRRWRGKNQLFVKWADFGDEYNQWIDEEDVAQQYNN